MPRFSHHFGIHSIMASFMIERKCTKFLANVYVADNDQNCTDNPVISQLHLQIHTDISCDDDFETISCWNEREIYGVLDGSSDQSHGLPVNVSIEITKLERFLYLFVFYYRGIEDETLDTLTAYPCDDEPTTCRTRNVWFPNDISRFNRNLCVSHGSSTSTRFGLDFRGVYVLAASFTVTLKRSLTERSSHEIHE